MIIVTLHLKVTPEKRGQILEIFRSMIGPTTVQPGCRHCDLLVSTQDDDLLVLLEKWESQETLNQHIKTDEFRNVLVAMDKAYALPQINFYKAESCEGMELVRKLLGGNL